MSDADDALQLLLTDAEALLPVLETGLPGSSLLAAPEPERGPRGKDSLELAAPDRDPNDLPAQRWAVIAVRGEDGDRALAAIQALIDHRGAQQGAPPTIFRVDPGMTAAAAVRWRSDVLHAEDVPEDLRPRYLLILGDLDRVSLELQHVLAAGALVGRLHCPTPQGYRAYAEKVVARERAEPEPRGRALFYTVQDGTSAIQTGYERLVEPCMTMTGEWSSTGKLDLTGVHEIPYSDWGPDEFLTVAGEPGPSVMLSLSHGLGAPRRGWKSPDHQRALQGALATGLESSLAADTVRDAAFLPGGVWFCVACFAAGTPEASAFHPWLAYLAEHGGGDRAAADAVLRSLPRPGERPFVAALPQALLANPRGPLAVIGHMDLAWTFGFTDVRSRKSRASRVFSALRTLLAGSRVGVGLDALMSVYREVNDDLTGSYQLQRDALSRGQPDPVAPRALGQLWMQRNDLRGYVLLGDPAARLPVRSEQPALQDRPPPRPPELRTQPTPRPATAPPPVPAATSQPPAAAQPVPTATSQPPAAQPVPTATSQPPAAAPPVPTATSQPAPVPTATSQTPAAAAPPVPAATSQPPAAAPPVPAATSQAPAAVPPLPELRPQPPVPAASPTDAPGPRRTSAPPHPEAPMTTPSNVPPAPEAGHPAPLPPQGAAPYTAITRPRTLENPEIALRERAVLAMLRGDEAPRAIAVRFGLPLEEIFYWLDVYREAGRRALAG